LHHPTHIADSEAYLVVGLLYSPLETSTKFSFGSSVITQSSVLNNWLWNSTELLVSLNARMSFLSDVITNIFSPYADSYEN